jgi:apolipoprotein N-acyltransferase
VKWLLAAGAGVLWALQFGREPHIVAPWLALAPLLLLLSSTRASGRLAFVFGFVSWLTALSWIVPTLVTYGGISQPIAWPLTSLLAAYLAGFDAAFGWLGGKVWRRGGYWGTAARLLVLPSLWVALEWLRTYLFGGFPWNLAAYSWVEVAGALPLSAWIGPYGISFLVVLTSVGAATAVQRRRWEPLAAAWALPLLLLPLAGRWSLREGMEEHAAAGIIDQEGVPVRLIQPNIANLTEYDAMAVLRNYRKVVDASVQACQPGSLVVWPESAAWPFSYAKDPMLRADLETLVKRGCTVLFNSSHPVEESFFNSAYLLSPQGSVHRYDKRHLVPFGEYIPFRGLFSWMDKLARNAGDFRAAAGVTLLPWDREKLGMAICYEVVYPAEVAELARRGSTILVTITNDAWYGDTWAPWQHYRAARFRAAENRRPLLRAAITGVSAIVGPDGSVWSQLGVFREGVIRARVLGRSGLTFYARHPSLVPLLASIVSVLSAAALVALYFARKEKRP